MIVVGTITDSHNIAIHAHEFTTLADVLGDVKAFLDMVCGFSEFSVDVLAPLFVVCVVSDNWQTSE